METETQTNKRVWISDKQKSTMVLIDELLQEFGKDRWFTQHELPGVTRHTMDALVEKEFLKYRIYATKAVIPIVITYYQRLKTMEK